MPYHNRGDSDEEAMPKRGERSLVLSRRSLGGENAALARAEVVGDNEIGMIPASSFNAALWAYTARLNAYKASEAGDSLMDGDAGPRNPVESRIKLRKGGKKMSAPANVGPRKPLEKHIKMLSLNPSVYGNMYGVLGSS